MSSINSCYNCHALLTYFTPLYYCCNQSTLLCKRCKPLACPRCKTNNWKEMKEKQCRICRRKLGMKEGLKEDYCGDYYCPRCLSNIYLPHYLTNNTSSTIQLRCGHPKNKLDIEAVLNQYCINCGYKYKDTLDYQLQGSMKLCHFCFQYEGPKFEQFFKRCLSCGIILKCNEGVTRFQVLLCKQCCQSQIFIEQSIVNSNFMETNKTSIISELKSQKLNPNCNVQVDDQPSEQLSIVSRFSAFQIEDQGAKKKNNRLSSMRVLSKNSVQIRVQNYKLPSIVKDDCQLVKCQLCNILLCVDGTLPNTTYSKSRICKMCFAQTFDKSYISYSRQSNTQSNAQNQRVNSLPKNNHLAQPSHNKMKTSMIGQTQNPILPSMTSPSKVPIIVGKVDKKEPWELASSIRNPCEICQLKNYIITRADKKKVCADCGNKYR